MHRLFVAIRPPEWVRQMLLDTMDGPPSLRWQEDAQLHLTVRFIGAVERPMAEDIAVALTPLRFAPFTIALSGVGQFDHHRAGALWAGVTPRAPLAALAAKVDRACQSAGLPAERRAFHPHLTLARWNGVSTGVETFLIRHAALASGPFHVDRFSLFESRLSRHGPHYEEIAAFAAT